jgi:sialate O-acetylesterase
MKQAILILCLCVSVAQAEVKLASVFGDYMVLQRGAVAPVWGTAVPGEKVTVEFAGQTKRTVAGLDGKWRVRLDAINDLKVSPLFKVTGENVIRLKEVLVGEVWFASGQSNMAWPVSKCRDFEKEKAAAKFQHIRMFTTARKPALEPQTTVDGKWTECAPETVGGFSGTAYFFARAVHEKLKVPVGIVHSSWGGTAIEAWTSWEVQKNDKRLQMVHQPWKDKAAADRNKPANLFNGMVNPHIPYAIRGAIWYQGERNSRHIGFAKAYAIQLPMMINDWRRHWGQGDFPFLFVQLPNFKAVNPDPNAPSIWAYTRESMAKTLVLPNTGMATTIDIGEAKDIHPKNKQDVGRRLANWALAEFYNQVDVPTSGPLYESHKTEVAKVIITFSHAKGLAVKGSREVAGFAMAGADKKFYGATAIIRKDGRVEVTCELVDQPAAIRYGWADNPVVNLINQHGLPAAPFRTDDW